MKIYHAFARSMTAVLFAALLMAVEAFGYLAGDSGPVKFVLKVTPSSARACSVDTVSCSVSSPVAAGRSAAGSQLSRAAGVNADAEDDWDR